MDNLEKVEDMEIVKADNCFADNVFERIDRVAEMMSSAKCTIPAHLQGNKADCFAICMQSFQWGMNPYIVAQKTMIVNGKLGYEAQLVNAVVSGLGAIVGVFNFEYRGDGEALECRVGAIPRGYDEIKWGEWLKLSSVTIRNSPLWKTNPKQQLGYLQVKNWARLYAPGTMLGVYTPDELETTKPPKSRIPDAAKIVGKISIDQFQEMENLGKSRGLTKDERQFIYETISKTSIAKEIDEAYFVEIMTAIGAAEHGKVLPE